jgi:hypothetical protein
MKTLLKSELVKWAALILLVWLLLDQVAPGLKESPYNAF